MGFDVAGAPAGPADDAVAVLIHRALPMPAALDGWTSARSAGRGARLRVMGFPRASIAAKVGSSSAQPAAMARWFKLVQQAQCQDFQQQIAGADGKVTFALGA